MTTGPGWRSRTRLVPDRTCRPCFPAARHALPEEPGRPKLSKPLLQLLVYVLLRGQCAIDTSLPAEFFSVVRSRFFASTFAESSRAATSSTLSSVSLGSTRSPSRNEPEMICRQLAFGLITNCAVAFSWYIHVFTGNAVMAWAVFSSAAALSAATPKSRKVSAIAPMKGPAAMMLGCTGGGRGTSGGSGFLA